MNAKNTQKHITRSVDIPGHCETDIDMDVINDHLNCDDITNFINNSKIIYFYNLIFWIDETLNICNVKVPHHISHATKMTTQYINDLSSENTSFKIRKMSGKNYQS